MKASLLLLSLMTNFTLASGQSVRDFFWPSGETGIKATFFAPDNIGLRSTFSLTRRYFKEESEMTSQNKYEILETNFHENNIISVSLKRIKFIGVDVKVISENAVSTLLGTNETTDYNPYRTLLRMPTQSQKRQTWSFTFESGEKHSYSSEWATTNVDGTERKAIKVTESIVLPDGENFGAKKISYFVEGIGFWREEAQDSENGNTQILIKFERFEN